MEEGGRSRIKMKISDFKTSQVPNRINKESSHLYIAVKLESTNDFKNLSLSRGKVINR